MPSGPQHGGDEAFLSIEGGMLKLELDVSSIPWGPTQPARGGRASSSALLRDGFVSAKVNLGFWTVAVRGDWGTDV